MSNRPRARRQRPHFDDLPDGWLSGQYSPDQMAHIVQSGHWVCLCGDLVMADDGPTCSAVVQLRRHRLVTIGGHSGCVYSYVESLPPL